MNHQDYIEAGFRIMALHRVESGRCQCGNSECQAQYKHPRMRNWQYTPHWSDEQLETMEKYGQLEQGFGVLVDDHIIIDIDPRNGGNAAYKKLCADTGIDFKAVSGFVVATGGGGWHIYFKRPSGMALLAHLHDYPGLDFKSSGFVVGAGSLHKSGMTYEAEHGHPEDIGAPPDALLVLLQKQHAHRVESGGAVVDLSDGDIEEMVSCIDADSEYDQWIKIGMAIHHATNGSGLAIWDNWSKTSKKYPDESTLERHWHSFGKSANPVTAATLFHHAREGGYKEPVTFDYQLEKAPDYPAGLVEEMLAAPFDARRPPSLVGEIADWINSQAINLRENLAVGAALYTVGSLAASKYTDVSHGQTPNLYVTCIAGSGSGKEHIIRCMKKMFGKCEMGGRVHTTIKSEQEMVRNLLSDPQCYYRLDEFGEFLAKVDHPMAPSYLQGIRRALLSGYSNSGSAYELSGDVRRETERELVKTISRLQKKVDENDDQTGKAKEQLEKHLHTLNNLDKGIAGFFLSMIGFTAPNKFIESMTYDAITGGFIGRCMFFRERDNNPKPKLNFTPDYDLPMGLWMALGSVSSGGGDIHTEEKARLALDECVIHFWEMAATGEKDSVEPVWRRAIELTMKVSLILAIPSGVRTFEHVCWAFNLVRKDTEDRVNLSVASIASADKERSGEVLMRKILSKIAKDHGASIGVLKSQCGVKYSKKDVEEAVKILAEAGEIVAKKTDNAKGPKTEKWYLAK